MPSDTYLLTSPEKTPSSQYYPFTAISSPVFVEPEQPSEPEPIPEPEPSVPSFFTPSYMLSSLFDRQNVADSSNSSPPSEISVFDDEDPAPTFGDVPLSTLFGAMESPPPAAVHSNTSPKFENLVFSEMESPATLQLKHPAQVDNELGVVFTHAQPFPGITLNNVRDQVEGDVSNSFEVFEAVPPEFGLDE